MKVLAISYLFPNNQYPNYGVFVRNRLLALQKYCEIKVVNPVPWFPFSSSFSRYHNFNLIKRRENIQGLEVYHPRFPIIPRYLTLLNALSYCSVVLPLALRIKKKFPFDIIDLHWTYPDLPVGYLLAKITARPVIATVRGNEALYKQEPGVSKFLVSWLLKRTNHNVTLSSMLKEQCVKNGVVANKISVIRNGVDNKKFKFLEKMSSRAQLGLPASEYIILSVGSLIYGKGFDRIIKALPGIIAWLPNARLYIIGSEGAAGFYKNELLELTIKLGVQKNVLFVGEVENSDLQYWYNAADLFCLASRGEGSPNVLTEALCCGCPAVATDVGSVKDIMEESFMGKVIPNTDDVGSGIVEAIGKEYPRERISSHMVKYDWDWCARQVLSVYEDVVSGVSS